MSTCHGCDSALPEGASYCPRCGLAAGAPAPQLPAWRPPPARRPAAPKPPADVWAGPPDGPVAKEANVLAAATPGPDRRRLIVIATCALLALVVAAIVGVDQFGGGKTSSSPTQAPITSLPPQVQGTAVSPIFPAQNDLVTVAQGVQDSSALAATIELLSRYFKAINSHHDYEAWVRTLVPHPGRATSADYYAGYKTTIDSDVVIHGITVDRESHLRVDVSFVSRQDPRPGSLQNCTSWEISYTLVPSSVAGLRIDLVSSDRVSALNC